MSSYVPRDGGDARPLSDLAFESGCGDVTE
jgi:hypothetical protein